MAKTRQQKVAIVDDLKSGIGSAKGMVFANFQGLSIKDTDELRALCRESGVRYVIGKKTLMKKALSEAGYAIDTTAFAGGVSVLLGESDEVAPAQIIAKFAKTHEAAKVFGGVLEGAFIDEAKVMALSKLPGKQQLLGQLVGTLNAPISGFARVLAGNLRGLVTVMSAIKDKKPA